MKPEVVAARIGGVGELSPLIRDVDDFEDLVESSCWSAPREDAGGAAAGRRETGAVVPDAAAAAHRLAQIKDYFKDTGRGSPDR